MASANSIITFDLTETFLWLGKSSWSTVFLICFAGVITVYVYARLPTWKLPNIPSPPESWLFGHLPLIAKGGPDVFISLARKYGPIYRFNFGRQPLVIVADAELCREAGIKKFKFLSNRSIPSPIAASPLHQKGLFFTRDSRWSSMRGTIQSLYQPSRIANQVPLMERTICILKDHLSTKDEKEDINFSELLLKVATDIIGEAAFGERFDLTQSTSVHPVQEEVSEFVKQHVYSTTSLKMDLTGTFSIIMGILFPIVQEPFRQILSRIPGTGDWKVEQNNRKLTDRLNAIVAKRSMDLGLESRTDFLSSVLNARESSKDVRNLFSPDYISSLTYEHLLAGSATTSFTLSMVLYLVSAHPHVENKLLQEIDAFVPPGRNPTAEDLDKFPYLTQVIKEAMRYYTVSPLIAREANEDVEIGGYLLPKGTWVWLALNALAKDPIYFPKPEIFKPERFDPKCEEEKKRHSYANIPFGIGPRACIGMRFSLQEIKVALIHLYQLFTFEHSPLMEKPLAFQYGMVLSPKFGVKLRVHQRRTYKTNF
ncbi:hypothetical protein SUGI_0477360 [Cryptomeria japonica]|uniref:cytochrome P450 711A1 n=1 Tax=Cryptomeria japonica TaxID=3369 RepID=UPI002408CC4B|nr:cytochrome P450 711A1 [Cryptomeria japonica]GLJ24943.1 hypothetical protein SUGI_0477360 [Cryptomeria japonica]